MDARERLYGGRLLRSIEALRSELGDFLSWQRFIERNRNRVETRTFRGVYHIDRLAAEGHEREICQMAQEELARQMARQILQVADWHEIESADGKNIYIEVDAVVKPNRHTLGGE